MYRRLVRDSRAQILGVLILGLASIPATADNAVRQLEVFTTAQFPIIGAEPLRRSGTIVSIHLVDKVDHFHSAFSDGLPTSQAAAQTEVLRRLEEHPEWIDGLANGWASRVKAQQYGLRTIPAVVPDTDPTRAVYGETDLLKALDRIQGQ